MKRTAKIIFAIMLGMVFIISSYSFSEDTGNAVKLMKEAKAYIEKGNGEKAISTLDAAFKSANSAGDYESLMEIGDLYIGVDSSLDEKAMRAWTAAGHWKCQ